MIVGPPWGWFEGVPELRVNPDDSKTFILTSGFEYNAPDGTVYTAHRGLVTDFASFPWWSLSVLGSPAQGRHRKAALIHDQLCADARTKHRPHPSSDVVHAVFYCALRACGVPAWRARLFWAAVRVFGPKFPARLAA